MTEVPDEEHLMRYVPRPQQRRDIETDEFLGILNTAFSIREEDKGGLSVTWVEHYGPNCAATIALGGAAFRDSLPSKKLSKFAYFAIGNAGATRKAGKEYGKKLRLIPAPDGPNTGHVEIHRFNDEDRRLLDALAMEVFVEHVSVVSMGISLKR